ncbi:23S rRNA (uracil-5-)-methyltransferase RumA, partial [Escherichia coli]|nr:23S rRNA (uracil-5-)-methyltransferase RumA [Escherichia coli]
IASGTEYSQMNAIGFHITGAFDKILPIDKCHLMDDLHNRMRNSIRDYAYSTGMTFYDLRGKHGLLRDIVIRNSDTGEWMVLVQCHYDEEGDEARAKGLLQHIADNFPEVTALLYVDNQKANDTYNDLELQVFKGNDHI